MLHWGMAEKKTFTPINFVLLQLHMDEGACSLASVKAQMSPLLSLQKWDKI